MNPKTWNIDATHSGIHFSIRHMVISKVRGRFGKYEANLRIDDDDLAKSSVDVTIDAASIDTGVGQRDDHLRSPDFFDAARFPSLGYRSRSVQHVGEDRYRVVGDLTIRDVTREVVFDVEHGGHAKDPWGNDRVGFVGRTSLDRKDFGLTWNKALEAGGVLVGDRVDVEIEIEAVRAAAHQAA